MRILFAAMVVCSAVTGSQCLAGSFFTGNDLMQMCEQKNAFVVGYVVGVIEKTSDDLYVAMQISIATPVDQRRPLILLAEKIGMICLPSEVSTVQLRDVYCAYLKDHPSERHMESSKLVMQAMSSGFRCKN